MRPSIIVVLLLLGLAATVWTFDRFPASNGTGPARSADAQQHNGDFSLTDSSGKAVSLATYQGKWLLVFFGFTRCPEACPLALSQVGATFKAMGPAADQMQALFVTLDPERDSPALLREYLTNFEGNIVGLSGTVAETAAVAKVYGVYYRKIPTADGDYTLDHSTAFYLVDPRGSLIRAFAPDDGPEEFAKKLLSTMKTSATGEP